MTYTLTKEQHQQLVDALSTINIRPFNEALDLLINLPEVSGEPVGYAVPTFNFDNSVIRSVQYAGTVPLFTAPQPAADDARDATRYRWLRDPTTDVSLVLDKQTGWVPPDENIRGVGGYYNYEYRAGDELDAAIDAAMEQGVEHD